MSEDSEGKIVKFLTSDDPALRKMGLSLGSGVYIPESCYADIFALAFFDPESSNRELALKLISDSFPDLLGKLEKNWKKRPPSTRNESKAFEPYQMNYDWEVENFMNYLHKESGYQLFDSCQMVIRSYELLRGKDSRISDSYENLISGFVKFLGKEKYQPAKKIMIEIYNTYGDSGPGREVLTVASLFGGEDMEELLVRGLIHKNYSVVNSIDETAKQLVKMGSMSISERLVKELNISKVKVLFSVPKARDIIWVLGKLGHSGALEPLVNFCREELISSKQIWEPTSTSAFAVAELSEDNVDMSLEYLCDLLDHPSEWVVESGVYGLGMLGSKSCIPNIKKIIEGKRGRGHSRSFGWGHYMPLTRKTAERALETIKKGERLPPVKSPWPINHDWSKNEIWMD